MQAGAHAEIDCTCITSRTRPRLGLTHISSTLTRPHGSESEEQAEHDIDGDDDVKDNDDDIGVSDDVPSLKCGVSWFNSCNVARDGGLLSGKCCAYAELAAANSFMSARK